MNDYDPYWPFPQFDDDGKQLLPPDWNKRQPKPQPDFSDCKDAPF